MNGNYEFVRQMSRDRQSAFVKEAREYRMAKQAGSPDGRQGASYFAWASNQLHSAASWAGARASDYAASWRALRHGPGAATRQG